MVHLESYCVGPAILGTEPAAESGAVRSSDVVVWACPLPGLRVLLLREPFDVDHEHGGYHDQSVSPWIILVFLGYSPPLSLDSMLRGP